MQDPLTVALEIRRPWPAPDSWRTQVATRTGRRWHLDGPFWTIAGRGFYWPSFITIWHHDPSGVDDITCPIHPGNAWRWHIHHWRIQVHPAQHLRRRLLTRCHVCNGRSTRARPVNCRRGWARTPAPWWRGEQDLAHMDCLGLELDRG